MSLFYQILIMAFAGKVVLIFGGTSGIGLATAIAFAKAGANKVIVTGRYPERFKTALIKIDQSDIPQTVISYMKGDVRVESSVRDIIQSVITTYGKIDIFHNNAGVYPSGGGNLNNLNFSSVETGNGGIAYLLGPDCLPGQEYKLSTSCESPFATIAIGTMYCLKWEMFYAQQSSHNISIVSTASEAGSVGFEDGIIYAASKAAVISFTKSFAKYAAKHFGGRVRVNCVSPGPIDTPLLKMLSPEALASTIQNVPLKRMGQPEEVAQAVVYLSNPQWSSYVVGTNLHVDGGDTA
jgi:NAD(P)-dependent dehydrogenase (short-subunit alcohol dehydrogenase family)